MCEHITIARRQSQRSRRTAERFVRLGTVSVIIFSDVEINNNCPDTRFSVIVQLPRTRRKKKRLRPTIFKMTITTHV